MNRFTRSSKVGRRAIPVTLALLAAATGCVSSHTQLQTARTLDPGEWRIAAGASVPVSTRFVGAAADLIGLTADRLEEAEAAGRPVTEQEQRDALESAFALLVLQPSMVHELSVRRGLFDGVDVGIRSAGPAFAGDFKLRLLDASTAPIGLAARVGYTYHTGIGASLLAQGYDLAESAGFVDYGRQDLQAELLFGGDEKSIFGVYGGARYVASWVSLSGELAETLDPESGQRLLPAETVMHEVDATVGLRVGYEWIHVFAELGAGYMVFTPNALGEDIDLSGMMFTPALGVAVDI